MIVVVSPQARDDIGEAHRHLAADNPEAADHFLARVTEIIALLAAGGIEGRFVRLGAGRTVQTWPIPPYQSMTSKMTWLRQDCKNALPDMRRQRARSETESEGGIRVSRTDHSRKIVSRPFGSDRRPRWSASGRRPSA